MEPIPRDNVEYISIIHLPVLQAYLLKQANDKVAESGAAIAKLMATTVDDDVGEEAETATNAGALTLRPTKKSETQKMFEWLAHRS